MTKKKPVWPLVVMTVLPLGLVGVFYLLRGNRAVMDTWVFSVLAPVAQFMGRLWGWVPVSGMELMIVAAVLASLICLVRAVVLLVRERRGCTFLRRLIALGAAWLWAWCGLCWLWNVTYYASTFSQRSGLTAELYSVDTLTAVTEWFAVKTAELADEVPRDEAGHFNVSWREILENGPVSYENVTSEFPCLYAESIEVKPLICSRLQSIMGFTGMYFPFTGEANVNVDAPVCLLPCTVAHEMAHQRMVASELEANFVGVAACTTCDNVVYQYSGYLSGLMDLSAALYSVAPERWTVIVQNCFTAEMLVDWNDHNEYWRALDSQVEEVAEKAYDSFLKSNDQELGIRSYGACVDLLVAYYGPQMES